MLYRDSNYTALLRTVCEDPGDTVARLVLADWLEERGDPRGTFIRAQVELLAMRMRGQPAVWSDEDPENRRYNDLCGRERELFTWENIEAWFGHTPWLRTTISRSEFDTLAHEGIFAILVHRGFPAVITCTLADWVGRPCTRCDNGKVLELQAAPHAVYCPTCSGTGRVGGQGPAIVLAAPIEEVRLSDRTPSRIGPNPIVEWHREQPGETPDGGDLSSVLFDLLPGSGRGEGWACTGGTAMAMEILSATALTWARQQAGLPVRVFVPISS